ncbi:MAG: DUF3048 C-terminal domain-containing protein [Patescibacteria group bacterium]|nr:DUF3048 C-terminal domain-containing protein [Patescibacteria group bacterium]
MNKKLIITASFGCIAIVALAGCGCSKDKKEIASVEEEKELVGLVPYEAPENASPITGMECANPEKRSFAVMYSGSVDARPYWKNLDKADMVLEMPHRMHNEPRLMGFFQCNVPSELGPMRSGRVDHMAVADSMGSVFTTWGKSIVAAAAMNKNLVDNIEVGSGTTSEDGTRAGYIDPDIHFYSANSAYADLNGVIKMSKEKGYSSENLFEGFEHQGEIAMENRPSHGTVDVKFDTSQHRIKYEYDKETNSYKRFHKGEPSIDMASGQQYAPKNIIGIVAKRDAWLAEKDYTAEGLLDPWSGVPQEKIESNQYPNMQLGDPWFDTVFEGEAEFYFNGQEIDGSWKRERGKNQPFHFYDENGQEIHFVPGQIWMHVLPHGQKVGYEDEEEYNERIEDESTPDTGATIQ